MTFRLATRPAAQALRVPKTPLVRTVTSLSKVAYTAKAESSGAGRNGDVKLREGGPLKFQLTLPKSLGGSGEGHNPEQFFALGYSACFLSAVNAVARAQKVNLPKDIEVHADVSIGTPEGRQGFGLAVELLVKASYEAAQREELEGVIKAAHEMCPYSNAVRNNIPVKVSLA